MAARSPPRTKWGRLGTLYLVELPKWDNRRFKKRFRSFLVFSFFFGFIFDF